MKEIQLTQGKMAIVDDEDFEWLNTFNWYVSSNGYARRDKMINYKRFRYSMHREIMGLTSDDRDLEVDHINGNRLDNRRENLRVCTLKQNRQSQSKQKRNTTSKYKGVSFCKDRGNWKASIKTNGKTKFLGRFKDEDQAARAYNEKAIELFGDFAKLNIIGGNKNENSIVS